MTTSFLTFYQSLDPDPYKRGKQFEHFVKWFLQNDPEWQTQVDQVWLWDEWPQRWGADCGVDLVFRHKNGDHWAVQAKCYSPDYDITKHDVDKFLSESNRPIIQHRLLIATTDRIGNNAKQVCDAQDKPVIRFLLSDFEKAALEYPADFASLPQAKRKAPPAPRDHQNEAIAAVAKGLQAADRGQLIMACGTGKTYTTLWIKEKLGATRTLVLLPSLGLLAQTLREWTFAATTPFQWLCVCSDQTVTKGNDEAIHSVGDMGVAVTSDADEVKRFLSGADNRVVFSTYQSSLVVAAAQADASVPAFDLAVADEAHRCAGKVGSDFTAILDDAQIRSTKRLFATATPRTYSSNVKKAAEERGVEVVGMDDAEKFGEVLYALPFGKAIERKLLTDYRVVIIGVDDPTIAQWIAKRELVSLSPPRPMGEGGGEGAFREQPSPTRETDSESLAAQIGLLKAIKDYDLKRIISFHSRVKRAEDFTTDIQNTLQWISDEHRPSGALRTDFVSGNMPANKRKIKLDQLKALSADERGVLSNARCLSEGVDVPSLDGVAFIDPRSSQVDIIQAVGRAIRLSPDKKAGTIVLPVFIKAGEDAASTIEASNFKPIWEVLDALKAHDDVLADELDQIRTEMGKKSSRAVSADCLRKIAIDLPVNVDANFSSALRTCLVQQVTASWDEWFGELLAYKAVHGNTLVPRDWPTGLSTWVSNQRKRSLLLPERRERLSSIGFIWNVVDAQWNARFAELQTYKVEYGDANVPNDWQSGLGAWVGTQRQGKKLLTLTEEKIQRLNEIGFDWDPTESQWQQRFDELSAYGKIYGNLDVPVNWSTGLGSWVNVQRTFYKNGKLPSERIKQLSEAGFNWDYRAVKWEEMFRELLAYRSVHGDVQVPDEYPTGLGKWAGKQRAFNKRGLLPEERIQRLNEIEFDWDTLESKWNTKFNELIEYKAEFGDLKVPVSWPTGLGRWASVQRKLFRNGELSLERVCKLNEIGFEWER